MGAWLIQSKYMSQHVSRGNFETVVPVGSPPSLQHYYRDNDNSNQPWYGPYTVATGAPPGSAAFADIMGTEVTLFQSNYFSESGNFELFSLVSAPQEPYITLAHWYRSNDLQGNPWSPGNIFWGEDTSQKPVSGIASVIQGRCISPKGNFELLYPYGFGPNLYHIYRINDNASGSDDQTGGGIWKDTGGSSPGFSYKVSGVSLIQSRGLGKGDSFEALVTTGSPDNKLYHCYRDNSSLQNIQDVWTMGNNGQPVIPGNVRGSAAFIQSSGLNAGPGNFEAVVNIDGKSLQHWWRDNSQGGPAATWHQGETLPVNEDGSGIIYGGPTMIQSNYGDLGNFELLVCVDGNVQHWWRDNTDPNIPWNKGNGGIVKGGGVNFTQYPVS